MLRIDNAHNVKILGRGIFDGRGINICGSRKAVAEKNFVLKAGMQSHSAMYDVWFENNDVVQARRGIVAEATTGNELMSDIP
jgi:hypothetical protein